MEEIREGVPQQEEVNKQPILFHVSLNNSSGVGKIKLCGARFTAPSRPPPSRRHFRGASSMVVDDDEPRRAELGIASANAVVRMAQNSVDVIVERVIGITKDSALWDPTDANAEEKREALELLLLSRPGTFLGDNNLFSSFY